MWLLKKQGLVLYAERAVCGIHTCWPVLVKIRYYSGLLRFHIQATIEEEEDGAGKCTSWIKIMLISAKKLADYRKN